MCPGGCSILTLIITSHEWPLMHSDHLHWTQPHCHHQCIAIRCWSCCCFGRQNEFLQMISWFIFYIHSRQCLQTLLFFFRWPNKMLVICDFLLLLPLEADAVTVANCDILPCCCNQHCLTAIWPNTCDWFVCFSLPNILSAPDQYRQRRLIQ